MIRGEQKCRRRMEMWWYFFSDREEVCLLLLHHPSLLPSLFPITWRVWSVSSSVSKKLLIHFWYSRQALVQQSRISSLHFARKPRRYSVNFFCLLMMKQKKRHHQEQEDWLPSFQSRWLTWKIIRCLLGAHLLGLCSLDFCRHHQLHFKVY